MNEPPTHTPAQPVRWTLFLAAFLVIAVVYGCSIYANLSFAVTNKVNFKYFPPFKPYENANHNDHLGAEYFNIAKAMVAGKGFANPFKDDTGPTAWMPPVLPTLLAGLLWITDGDKDSVMAIFIFLQVNTLIATGILVLALSWQTTRRLWAVAVAAIFLAGVSCDFRMWFQFTHDTWLVLLALDIVIAGLCWGRPLETWPRSAAWGICGGFCALINPIVGMTWGVLSLVTMVRERAWYRFGIAAVLAAVTLSPWIVRNYLVFGRLIPVKSNAAYELFQSQCLLPDGLLQPRAFAVHPYGSANPERREYKRVGEMAFLDQKRDLFWQSVRNDPLDFLDRVASRFLGATLWYVPFDRQGEARRPVVLWMSRLTHPLPFIAFLVLGFSAIFRRPHWVQWGALGTYVLYLSPYVGISYYERYAMPLLGVKVLLVIWAADLMLCGVLWFGDRLLARMRPSEPAVVVIEATPTVRAPRPVAKSGKTK